MHPLTGRGRSLIGALRSGEDGHVVLWPSYGYGQGRWASLSLCPAVESYLVWALPNITLNNAAVAVPSPRPLPEGEGALERTPSAVSFATDLNPV